MRHTPPVNPNFSFNLIQLLIRTYCRRYLLGFMFDVWLAYNTVRVCVYTYVATWIVIDPFFLLL